MEFIKKYFSFACLAVVYFVEILPSSFIHRLVIDRETGKPKGYGFCEYKDEETALSARRNLQGYEINGRQLRVDFAENDKGNDRNREQVCCLNFLEWQHLFFDERVANNMKRSSSPKSSPRHITYAP